MAVRPIKPLASVAHLRLAGLFLAGAVIVLATRAFAATAETASLNVDHGVTTVSVESPRPIASAVQALVACDGILITYEDPPYRYKGDVQDVTREVAKGWAKYFPGTVIVPLGGKLTVSVPSNNVAVILRKLVEAQNESGTGGRFRVEQTGDAFHIVPVANRDRDGNWVASTSILDVPISLPDQERTGPEMISAICSAVGAAAHVEVANLMGLEQGIRSVNGLSRYPFRANNEVARSVLMRALAVVAHERGRLSWLLFRDPENATYFLNYLVVPDKSVPVPQPVYPTRDVGATPQYHGTGVR